ncbi:hypothetical protein [Pseudomonas turukhanskensis]|uniref:Uncharacterized protein n=1 Tax=Pseudomonas turukhanskensis TaxID=1806536 RepID=A0A9W6K7G1_9PSED|nr:hypothetical protein [Pseudomonas turukhanskensis]GLK88879.1 hypothetical protein GCM10017655_19410 [Pseudomonas turukhanskensis]
MNNVHVEYVRLRGQQCWRVRIGYRGVTFQEELAARTFAAQLHQRLTWLRARENAGELDEDD